MNELIKIETTDNGKQVVSARELYLGLGLNKKVWSRWYKTNIQENEYFHEGIDWIGVLHNVEGNEVQDFAISIEFAKHIAMMARTEMSHKYRNYFIVCEEKAKATPQLSKELQAIFLMDKRTVELDERLKVVENNMTIDYGQQLDLNELAKKKVVSILGGKDSPAYKELNKKAFSQIWKDFKRIMNVNSYKNTAVKDLDMARKVIIDWKPTRELELMIKGCNSQLRM